MKTAVLILETAVVVLSLLAGFGAFGGPVIVRIALAFFALFIIPGFSLSDCDPIKTDSIRWVVSWKGNRSLTQLAGKPVCLKFEMQDAKLYALQFSR